MGWSFPGVLALIACPTISEAAVVSDITASFSQLKSVWVRDGSFNSAAARIIETQGSDAEGFDWRSESASVDYAMTSTSTNGTRTLSGTETFEGWHRQRLESSGSHLRLETETRLSATLDSQITHQLVAANFFFVTVVENKMTSEFRRAVGILVDQPLRITLTCGYDSPLPPATDSFNRVFDFANLVRADPTPPRILFSLGSSTYVAGQDNVFGGSYSNRGINLQVAGSADNRGMNLVIDLAPAVEGQSEWVNFQWLLDPQLNLSHISAHSGTSNKSLSGGIAFRESFEIRAIPEPGLPLMVAMAGASFLALRRRLPGSPPP